MDRPETKYAKSGDVHIAYQVFGSGDLDVVVVPGFTSHVELLWEHEPAARSLEGLASFARVITFDRRGSGLSDPVPDAPSLETADGRRARGDGRGGLRARGARGHLRGRVDEHPVRRHLSRPGAGARLLRGHGPLDVGRGLPVRRPRSRR